MHRRAQQGAPLHCDLMPLRFAPSRDARRALLHGMFTGNLTYFPIGFAVGFGVLVGFTVGLAVGVAVGFSVGLTVG